MNDHKQARMTVHSQLQLVQRARQAAGSWWPQRRRPDLRSTAYTWLARYPAGGELALLYLISSPSLSPHHLLS